jgi:hypothetical protein
MTLLPILIPEGFELKVAVGNKVDSGDVLAEGVEKGHEEVIHISHELKLIPQKAIKTLKKHLGDSVAEGEILANKSSLLGGHKIISQFSGIIVNIDTEKGDVYIRLLGSQNVKTITAPVGGTVDSINKQQVVLKTDKEAIVAVDGVGGEGEGEIEAITSLDERVLDHRVEGKVLLAKDFDKVALFKAVGLEAAGIVAENLTDIDFVDLQGKNVRMPVLTVAEEDFRKLVKLNSKRVYLSGKNKSIIVI